MTLQASYLPGLLGLFHAPACPVASRDGHDLPGLVGDVFKRSSVVADIIEGY